MTANSPLNSVADYLFGYDFFISYSWSDGRHYAVQLHHELTKLGFACFLDSKDYAKGDNWREKGIRYLRKTSRLILIGSEGALTSAPVKAELELFASLNRGIIPIDVNGALASLPRGSELGTFLHNEVLRIVEPLTSLELGPDPETITDIVRSFDLARQNQKRLRVLSIALVVFMVVALTAIVFGLLAETRRQQVLVQRDLEAVARQEAEAAQTRAEIRLSANLIEAKEYDRARRSLAEVAPAYRNWVWKFLEQEARPFTARWELPAVPKAIRGAENGSALVALVDGSVWRLEVDASGPQSIEIADVLSGQKLSARAAFSRSGSGLVITDGNDVVWHDLASGTEQMRWRLSSGPYTAFGPTYLPTTDETKLLVAQATEAVRLFESTAAQPVWVSRQLPERNLDVMTFSPDGQFIAMANHPVIKIDSNNGRRIISIPNRWSSAALVWTANDWVVGGGPDGRLIVLNGETFVTKELPTLPLADIYSMATFGNQILIGDINGVAQLVEISDTGHLSPRGELAGHDGTVQSLDLGAEFAWVGDRSAVTSWKLSELDSLSELQLRVPIWRLAFSPDGTRLAASVHRAEGTPSVQIIDLTNGKELIQTVDFDEVICSGIAWSPQGAELSAVAGHKAVVYDYSGALIHERDVPEHFLHAVAYVPKSATQLFGGTQALGMAKSLNDPIEWHDTGLPGSVRVIATDEKREVAWLVSDQGHLAAWDWTTQQIVFHCQAVDGFTNAMSVSAKNGHVAVGSANGEIVVFNSAGTLLRELKNYSGEIASLNFIDEGSTLQVGYSDGVVAFFDALSLALVYQSKPHAEEVRGTAWHSTTQRLATGDQSGKIRLWSGK